MEFTTAEKARKYLNKALNVQIAVLRQLTADEVKVVAQIASESSEVEKFIQAYTKHTRRLGETNVHLNRDNFGLRMKFAKFAEKNLPTFVKIAKSTIEFVSTLAIEQHKLAIEQNQRAEKIQQESVSLYTEIADDFEKDISEYQKRFLMLDKEIQEIKNENLKLKEENKRLKEEIKMLRKMVDGDEIA